MTQLPTKAQFTSKSVTKGAFRSAISSMVDYLSGLMGTAGDVVTARNALGIIPAFQVYPNTVNDLTVKVDAGTLFFGTSVTTKLLQSVSGFTASGSNQRIDRVVLDSATGVASRIAGADSASPVAPAIPDGKIPLAQIGPFTTLTTAITLAMVVDERPAIGIRPGASAAGKILGLPWGVAGPAGSKEISLPGSGMRQTVLSAAISAGLGNHISAGAGLNFNVAATATPCVISHASGFHDAGSKDFITVLTADASNQGTLAASNTNFIFDDWTNESSVVWGSCLIPPQYEFSFDRLQAALLNFEGTNGATVTTDDFGNTWTLTAATISTAQAKFGSSSLDCTGGAKYATNSSFRSLGDGSWEMSVWFRINALPGSGAAGIFASARNAGGFGAEVGLLNTAGTTKIFVNLSSGGTSFDISGGGVGTNTTWTLNQWNKARLVFDALAGTYKVYLSLNGGAETADLSISNAARICGVAAMRLGADASSAGSTFNGWLDAFRFVRAATNTTTETPSVSTPTIADLKVHWFSIHEMKMYEVTGASVTAGVDPTFTQRSRVFHAEQDTNGSTVTATRVYALKGTYDSGVISPAPAGGTLTTKNHNIGTFKVQAQVNHVNLTPENGYSVNYEWMGPTMIYDGTNVRPMVVVLGSRNQVGFQTGSSGISAVNLSSGAAVGFTVGSWGYRVVARRTF